MVYPLHVPSHILFPLIFQVKVICQRSVLLWSLIMLTLLVILWFQLNTKYLNKIRMNRKKTSFVKIKYLERKTHFIYYYKKFPPKYSKKKKLITLLQLIKVCQKLMLIELVKTVTFYFKRRKTTLRTWYKMLKTINHCKAELYKPRN